MQWLNDLKSQVRIIDVVRRYVKIEKIMNNKALIKCPFHADKTPSCHVGENNLFYCFGCHEGGDVIKFVQKIEDMSFMDAVQKIAVIYNFEIPRTNRPNRYFLIMNKLIEWCIQIIQSDLCKNHLQYLINRGLSLNTIKEFRIGYMPTLQDINKFCNINDISDNDLQNLGINKGILYMLQSRIIFPIYKNHSIVAMAGRYISERKEPKYLNTAETQYFKKKETLYYHHNLQNKRHECIYLVEGYLDVCMLYQNGLCAAAAMGTACDINHITQLWEHSDEICILLDGDSAGRKAAAKLACNALEIIKPGKIVTFIELNNDMDPADYINRNINITTLHKKTLADKIWSIFDPKSKLNPEHIVAQYKAILALADKIKDYDLRQLYKNHWKMMWRDSKNHNNKQITNHAKYTQNHIKDKQVFIMLGMLCHYPQMIDNLYDYIEYLPLNDNDAKIKNIILQCYHNNINIFDDIINIFDMTILHTYAPFLKKDAKLNDLIDIWLEIFDFFIKTLSN